MSEQNIRVITPDEFALVLERFLDNLKENEVVEDYTHSKSERQFNITFNPEGLKRAIKEIGEETSVDEFIEKGLFYNRAAIVKDVFKDEDLDGKIISLSMFSTKYEPEINEYALIVNY